MQDEFYAIAFRKKIYNSIDELQADVDLWLEYYNKERPHSGKYCLGKTPWQTWTQTLHLTKTKMLETHFQKDVSLHLTGEAETGSGGDQPARNNPSDWNGLGANQSPQFPMIIPRENTSKNSSPV